MEIVHRWEYEEGDIVLIPFNPGRFSFISETEWHHWNEYNDTHYPVHGRIIKIDKMEETVIVQINGEYYSVHHFRLMYVQSHHCVFDPIML